MKRVVGTILFGLGVLLLVLGPALKWYVAPHLMVSSVRSACDPGPLCDAGVSLSPSSGMATSLFDPATLTSKSNVPIDSLQRVKVDIPASTGDDNRAVYESFTNTTDDAGTTIDASTERIPFNAKSSQMLNCCDANENGAAITDFTGINPYKFPFGTEQKTYQYFDGTLAKSLPMEFQGTDVVNGLSVLKFVQTIPATQTGELEVPGSLVGQPDEDAVTAPRFYQNVRTVWVEPVTGIVINGQEEQKQFLAGADGTTAALTIIEAVVKFTDQNVSESVKGAQDGASQLKLIQTTIPIVGVVLGIVLIVLGAWLAWRRNESSASAPGATAPSV